jgi:hypothetical protein
MSNRHQEHERVVAVWCVGRSERDQTRGLVALDLTASNAVMAASRALPTASVRGLAQEACASPEVRARLAESLTEILGGTAVPDEPVWKMRQEDTKAEWRKVIANGWANPGQARLPDDKVVAVFPATMSAFSVATNTPREMQTPEKWREICLAAARAIEKELAVIFGPEALLATQTADTEAEANAFYAKASAMASAHVERAALLGDLGERTDGASPVAGAAQEAQPKARPKSL